VKIRSFAKANGAGHFNIASSQSKGKASGPSTPRKPRVVADGGSKDASTPTSGGGSKCKRAGPKAATVEDVNDDDDDDDDDDEESFGGGMKVSSHEAAWLQSDVSADAYPTPSGDKEPGNGGLRCEDVGEEGSPSKKARRGGVVKVEKYASDGGGDGESSVSEFADADAV